MRLAGRNLALRLPSARRGLILLLAALAPLAVSPPALAESGSGLERIRLDGRVTRVLDGDTIEVERIRIRLWGIQAPETHQPGGAASAAHLRRLALGRRVACRMKQRTTTRGRFVMACRLETGAAASPAPETGADLAMAQRCAGHARDWPRYSGGAYRACRPAPTLP